MKHSVQMRVAAVVTASAIALGISACSSETTPAEGSDVVQVYLAQHTWTNAIKQLIPDFEAETGLKVELTELGSDQLADQQQVKLNAASSDIDVMMLSPTRQTAQFHDNGWLSDITADVTGSSEWDWSDFAETTQGSVTVGDKIYGVPLVLERFALYYRKDLLAAAGIEVPNTIEELETAVAALNNPNDGLYGFISRGQRGVVAATFASFLYSITGEDYIVDGKANLSSPKALEALERYGSLLKDYGPPGVLDMNWTQAVPIFQQGQAAFYHDADSIFASFFDDTSKVKDSVGFAPFPKGDNGRRAAAIASWALGVNEYSKNKENAWRFIEWATSQKVSAQTMTSLVPSPRASVWEDADAVANYPADLVQLILNPPADLELVDHVSPLLINAAEARDIVGVPIVTAIQGGDIKAAAAEADAKLQKLIDSEK